MSREQVSTEFDFWQISVIVHHSASDPGAPNEKIVQNHLNIALLNVFKYLNGRHRHIFIP